jgi:hypothetical protein
LSSTTVPAASASETCLRPRSCLARDRLNGIPILRVTRQD